MTVLCHYERNKVECGNLFKDKLVFNVTPSEIIGSGAHCNLVSIRDLVEKVLDTIFPSLYSEKSLELTDKVITNETKQSEVIF